MIPRRLLLAAVLTLGLAPISARASEKESEAKLSPYLELPTLTATVIRADGRRGVLTVQASVYLPSETMQVKAPKRLPLLLNAYVPAMQQWAYALNPGATPNVDLLGSALQKATDQVLGAGGVVLLGGVMIN